MIHVIAAITVREGCRSEFIDIFNTNVPLVQKEKGCIEYLPAVDVDTLLPPQKKEPQVVTVIEKWERLEDLYAHIQAPHMMAYQQKVKDLVEDVVLKVLTDA